MAKILILYDLNEKTSAQKTRIIRTLYGFKDKSCHGKYEYQRPGLLSKTSYQRLTKTALLIEHADQSKVVRALKKLDITPIVARLNP